MKTETFKVGQIVDYKGKWCIITAVVSWNFYSYIGKENTYKFCGNVYGDKLKSITYQR
jgi:hypothetical protein